MLSILVSPPEIETDAQDIHTRKGHDEIYAELSSACPSVLLTNQRRVMKRFQLWKESSAVDLCDFIRWKGLLENVLEKLVTTLRICEDQLSR